MVSPSTENYKGHGSAHVIAFRAKPTIAELKARATGRNRKEALPVIIARLKELRVQTTSMVRQARAHGSDYACAFELVLVGNIAVEFIAENACTPGTYFSVAIGGERGPRVMTGYLNLPGPKDMHVMSWEARCVAG